MRTISFVSIFLLVATTSFVAADNAGVDSVINLFNIVYNASAMIQPQVNSLATGGANFNSVTTSINEITLSTMKELQSAIIASVGPLLAVAITLVTAAIGVALSLIGPVIALLGPVLGGL